MCYSNVVRLFFNRALTSLEVGQVGIVKFGQKGKCGVVHDPEKPFTDSDGERLVKEFSFSQDNHVGDSPVQEMLDAVFQLVDQRPTSSNQDHVAQQLVLVRRVEFRFPIYIRPPVLVVNFLKCLLLVIFTHVVLRLQLQPCVINIKIINGLLLALWRCL